MEGPERIVPKGTRVRARVGRLLLGFCFAAADVSAQQIQYAEPVELTVAGSGAEFDAYGRRFSLKLTDNDRVLQKLSSQRKLDLQRYRLLRGVIDGEAALLQPVHHERGDLFVVFDYEYPHRLPRCVHRSGIRGG